MWPPKPIEEKSCALPHFYFRRQQILRGIFFTVPAVAAGTGYVAAVEILSKVGNLLIDNENILYSRFLVLIVS